MRLPRHAVALACASLILSACGGGDSSHTPSTSQAAGGTTLKAAAIAPITTNDTYIYVSLATGSTGNAVTFSNGVTSITLKKTDGTKVTSLDDLPEGIANHTWVTGGAPKGSLRVRFAAGTYRLTRGWVWPARASGVDANRQIVLEPKTATAVVNILGSEALTGTYSSTTGRVTATTSAVPFEQLWAQDARAIRARTPNAGGFFYVKDSAQGWPVTINGATTVVDSLNGATVAQQAFQADANGYQALSTAGKEAGAQVVLMDSWQASRHQVAELDAAGKRVRLNTASPWPIAANGTGERYFIENALAALDAPGEWYWSATSATAGKLQYIPTTALTNGAKVSLEVPRVEKLLTMQGTTASGNLARFVQFSGLKFRYAKTALPNTGYIDGQADVYVNAAIEINDAQNIEFANCEVSRSGGYGIWMNSKARNVTVSGSELFDLGAGGIKIGKARPASHDVTDDADASYPQLRTGAVTVTGNRIHDIGHIYPGSVGIWVGRSSDNVIYDNLITNTTYSGISVGWNWDATTSLASGNVITNNFLYNIGQYALADMGGIYLLGRAPGTKVMGNVIKEVRSFDGYASGSHGIYADEGSSELFLAYNVVLGANGNGFNLHYGESNWLESNVLANTTSGIAIGKRLTGSTNTPLTIATNHILAKTNDVIARAGDPSLMSTDASKQPIWVAPAPSFVGTTQVGSQYLPTGTTLAYAETLCTNCAANAGLKISDPTALNVPQVTGGPTLTPGTNVARNWSGVALSAAPSAARLWAGKVSDVPPRALDFQASQWPLGPTKLTGWQVLAQPGMTVAKDDPTVPASIQTDGNGVTYLALADTARTNFTWEPYIQKWLSYASGTATVSFTARFDANTNLDHIWRSDDNGTTVGPALSFVSNGSSINVVANGVVQATVPLNTWVSVTVSSPVATGSTWTLTLASSAGTQTIKGLKPGNADWHFLGPILFVSNANVATTTSFKAISATNTP